MLDKKEIRSLAIPAILYNITEPLIGLADTAIIGQIENNSTKAILFKKVDKIITKIINE